VEKILFALHSEKFRFFDKILATREPKEHMDRNLRCCCFCDRCVPLRPIRLWWRLATLRLGVEILMPCGTEHPGGRVAAKYRWIPLNIGGGNTSAGIRIRGTAGPESVRGCHFVRAEVSCQNRRKTPAQPGGQWQEKAAKSS
jgi:hypothetical protein